jgi:hypothetical protein
LSPGSKPIEDLEIRSFIDQILKTLNIDNIDKFEYSTYEKTWRNWIASSSYNKIRGLDNFEHSAYLSGSTNAFPEFISRYPGRRIRVSKSDFILTKIVSRVQQRELLPLEEDVLGSNDCIILSHPFSGNGRTLPDYQALLDAADKLNVPVMIDACYFTVGHGIDYDLTHISIKEIIRCEQIHTKTSKPCTFLFLNGRARPHRKYLWERFNQQGLLHNAIWTQLDPKPVRRSEFVLTQDSVDLLSRPGRIQRLPPEYEVEQYRNSTVTITAPEHQFIKHEMFANTWGEVYLQAEPYVDTYFSVITETV